MYWAVALSFAVIALLLWLLMGAYKKRITEAEKRIEEKAELEEEARKARERYRSSSEFRERVHDRYN